MLTAQLDHPGAAACRRFGKKSGYERWQPTGQIADGGAELQPRDTARTVRAGMNGQPVITDGPYLELKEVIGAVVMLECDDIDEAGGENRVTLS
ncbi:YciI family protein [Micromonospora sp. SL4-19]|uniref:YciI family protein n=1 Tax=Micromonospora sp. SL4-19 TaxID=3399129 RepID=UPI003A4D9211